MQSSNAANPDLLIITGLSGAGKSTAIRVFEDLRYFAIDGLPGSVMPQVAAIMLAEPMRIFQGMAIGVDVRQRNFIADFNAAIENLQKQGLKPKLIFLEASTSALIRRYAATRRPHPLETRQPGLEAAIAEEKELLAPVRAKADLIIDSTDYSAHDLRRRIQRFAQSKSEKGRRLDIKLLSFGFKRGLPQDSDFIFDLRFLANPFFVETLRPLSGKDPQVADYVFASPGAEEFKEKLIDLLCLALEQMEKEGRYRVTVALGCTGGRHRSVAMAEAVARHLRQSDYAVFLEHRDLNCEEKQGGET